MTTRTLDLDNLHLLTGSHYPNDEQRMCVMEAVAFLAGEEWSDHPPVQAESSARSSAHGTMCCPTISARSCASTSPSRWFGRHPEQEERRSWMALDWLVRVQAPAWSDSPG